jgi:hypothetical protein
MTASLMGAPAVVVPAAPVYELLLTATTGVSHHDPAAQDDSNRLQFNRQRQLVAGDFAAALPDQAQVDALLDRLRVPADVAGLFGDLSLAEFLAAALVRQFLDLYNHGEGAGLFSGRERYSRLEPRLRMAAVGAPSLRVWWDRLCHALQMPIHGSEADAALLPLLQVPRGLQQLVLRALADDYRALVALGRAWHQAARAQDPAYAERAGLAAPGNPDLIRLTWEARAIAAGSPVAAVLEVPAVSGNSLRHQVVREPGWWHLAAALDLPAGLPGNGLLAPGVEAIFVNGGNIRAGAKQPVDPFGLAWRIRATYPLLDLLGGVTDSFDLGESRLRVGGWIVCRENAAALAGSPAADLPAATVSVFDLLDEVTLTRQAGLTGLGQMIYTFETLAPGAQVLVRLTLTPQTPPLTRGALVAAVETYLAADATLGGQAARGFGHVAGAWLRRPAGDDQLRADYEAYLAEAADALRAGLLDGTLGCGRPVLS